jgi:hypothetical protein
VRDIDADPGLAVEIGRSFPIAGELQRLAGGEGRTYRAGRHVFRREHRRAEAAYAADLYASLPCAGFRAPRPVRARQGTWLSPESWSAWEYASGRSAGPADLPADALHRSLEGAPLAAALLTKDTAYTRAERAAWGEVPRDLDEDIAELAGPLLVGGGLPLARCGPDGPPALSHSRPDTRCSRTSALHRRPFYG